MTTCLRRDGRRIHKALNAPGHGDGAMPRVLLVVVLTTTTLLAGCMSDGTPFNPLDGGKPASRGDEFRVPGLHVGDLYTYGFGFRSDGDPPFEIAGTTQVNILEATSHVDGLGRVRDALHVLQSTPDGSFQEHYWVDAKTLKQFQLERGDGYNDTNHFTGGPVGQAPAQFTSYGNATGTLQRSLDDPLFEDFNFFGAFATGRSIPVGQDFAIDGNLWMRDDTILLRTGNWTSPVEAVDAGGWGAGRKLSFEAAYDEDGIRQSTTWTGTVSADVPLATEMTRRIRTDFGGLKMDVSFNATLQAFEAGTGAGFGPLAATAAGRRAADFAAWDRVPPEGSGDKLAFPLSEAVAALELDLTAKQFFTDHAGSYLRFGTLEETNTCGAYPAPPPGCHWYTWFTLFDAPDDYRMHAIVEKYADDAGTGVAFVPAVSRDYPFDVLFTLIGGEPPEPPSPSVIVMKSDFDLPDRSAFPRDALTTADALGVWKDAATSGNKDLKANLYFAWLQDDGYTHFVSHDDWVFPEHSLLFPLYDEGTMILERHTAMIGASGGLLENRNYDLHVEHK